jgi:hypothetical protein
MRREVIGTLCGAFLLMGLIAVLCRFEQPAPIILYSCPSSAGGALIELCPCRPCVTGDVREGLHPGEQ